MTNAWVFVVWGDIKYLVCAFAGAESLRLVKTGYKIVLMYANMTVPTRAMSPLFDEIKKTPLLEFKCRDPRTKKQKEYYGGTFSQTIITKYQCLSLEQYDKVMFVDSDVVFTKNCDALFDLSAPAGCFTNPFAEPYCKGGIKTVYGALKHGDKIPPATILKAFTDSFSVAGGMILLKPSKSDLKELTTWLRGITPIGHVASYSGIDEQYISEFYARKRQMWTHMDQKYQFFPWKKNWMPYSKNPLQDAYALHYYHDKPWEHGRGADWPDVKIWWQKYHAFERDYPELANKIRPHIGAYRPKPGSIKRTKK